MPNSVATTKLSLSLPASGRALDEVNKRYSVGGINSLPVYLVSGQGSRLRVRFSPDLRALALDTDFSSRILMGGS